MRASLFVSSVAVAASMLAAAIAALPAHADPDPPIPTVLPTAASPSPTPDKTDEPRTRPSPRRTPNPASEARPRRPRGPAPTPYGGPVAEALAYWRTLPKTPARTTTTLLGLLQRLLPPGVPLDQQAVIRGVGRFPIAGYVWYQDDWAAPRYEPYFHTHEGNDLFAANGTPVVACANGVIHKLMVGSIGGVSIWLRADDGTVYYYGHLRSYIPGIREGLRVRIGQPIATVGNSGIALDTYPHVHFEIHPNGGGPINPKTTLDAWLFEAEARAAGALRRAAATFSAARIGAARWRTLLGLLAEPAPPAPRVWTLALDPSSATGSLAESALDRLALEIDWNAVARRSVAAAAHGRSRLSAAARDDGVLAAIPSHA